MRALAALDAAEAENARLRATLEAIRGWDMLNPPQTDHVADLGWLRSLVDEISHQLKPKKGEQVHAKEQ